MSESSRWLWFTKNDSKTSVEGSTLSTQERHFGTHLWTYFALLKVPSIDKAFLKCKLYTLINAIEQYFIKT